MSDIGGGGDSGFNVGFIAIECGGIALFVLLAFLGRSARSRDEQSPWVVPRLLALALAFSVGVALYWNTAFPARGGIEGAARLLFDGPFSVAAGLAAIAPLVVYGARWSAPIPALAAIAYWVIFLFQ